MKKTIKPRGTFSPKTLAVTSSTAWAWLLWLLLFTLPAPVQAQFNYSTENGQITITGYTGLGGAVTIPSTINGLPVTRIGGHAFQDKSILTSVTIPNSITRIEDSAFNGCNSLTNATIGNSVATIGVYAFVSCSSLTSVTIGNSVTNIGHVAFYRCDSLTSVSIPSSVANIGDTAFASCTSLTNVTIPSSVTNIGYGAFAGCSSLTNATIGNSVTSIGYRAFENCTSLIAIDVDAPNPAYSSVDGVLFNKDRTWLILTQYPGGKAGSYTVPNSVITIGSEAFFGCTSLWRLAIRRGQKLGGWATGAEVFLSGGG